MKTTKQTKSDKTDKDDNVGKTDKSGQERQRKDGKDASADAKPAAPKPPKPVRIDFDGLQQRIVALPVPEQGYDALAVSADGALWYLETRAPGIRVDAPGL